MKAIRISGIRLAAAVFTAACVPAAAFAQVARDQPAPTTTSRTGVVSGIVVRADDERQPVRAAQVAVIGITSGVTRVTITGDDGRFAIANLPPDRYNVGASKLPFLPAIAGARKPSRPGSAIALAAGETVSDVTIRLYSGASISGTIRDSNGEAAARVTLALLKWRTRNGERRLEGPLVTGTIDSDDRGRYRFFGLAPGDYVVVAMRSGGFAPHVLSQIDVDAVLSSNTVGVSRPLEWSVPVYFPGTFRPVEAGIVSVAAGEERTAIDFSLESAKQAKLQVTLSSLDGRALNGTRVSVGTSRDDAIFRQENSGGASQRTSSTFEFAVLPDTVLITGTAGVEGRSYRATAVVELGSGDERIVSLVLRPAMTIGGRVELDGVSTTKPALAEHRVDVRGLTGVPRGEFQPKAAPADAAGTFVVNGVVAGRYLIAGDGPGGWALQSVVVDGSDMTDRVIDVNADAPPKQIVVTYTDRWQEISGRLQLANGAPVNDYTVVIIPSDPSLWPFGTRRILTARPGTNGEFMFGGPGASTLPAGDYLLAAVTDIESDDLADPKYLAALAQAAIPIALKPGERKVQNLAVR